MPIPAGKYVGTFVICEEIDRLAHELAFEQAAASIESCTLNGEIEGAETWIDLDSAEWPLDREIRYLEARNRLRHHPQHPNLIQILEE